MGEALQIIQYIVIFLGIYIQVFMLLTYLGWGKKKSSVFEIDLKNDAILPTISVIVPCYNEEASAVRSVESLLSADYPHEKLQIIVIDDGSKDNTLKLLQEKYQGNPRVAIHTKSNGGKYTALNIGLGHATGDLVGCLDADSTIRADALRESAGYFLRDREIMAVVPTMTIENPKTIVQYLQKVEFEASLFLRETLGILGALFVAPGPLTLMRKEVFEKIGPWRHGYLGEDLEIAVRMQFNHLKIAYGNRVKVYTFGMKTFATLIKQRVRWTYAFLMNLKDYRVMFANPRYGHLGFFVFPTSLLTLFLVVILAPIMVYNIGLFVWNRIEPLLWGIGPSMSFDVFFINTKALPLLATAAFLVTIAAIFIGRRMNRQRLFTLDLLTFLAYPFVSTLWTLKTVWKISRSERITWR